MEHVDGMTTDEVAEFLGVKRSRVHFITYKKRLVPVGRRKVPGASKPMNVYARADVEDYATREQSATAC